MRYEKLDNKQQAIDCLHAVYSLAEQYGIEPDEDARALSIQLMAKATQIGKGKETGTLSHLCNEGN